jgi:hypothetical protein
VYLAGLFGGLSTALIGGNEEQIGVGNWAGSNAAANNALGHASKDLMREARECAANPTPACTTQIQAQAEKQDERFQAKFEAACTGSNATFAGCNVSFSAAGSALNDLELMRDMYSSNSEQHALYEQLIARQRTDMARMEPVLSTLRSGVSPMGLVFGESAPLASPADGARVAGTVAGTVLGSMRPLGLGFRADLPSHMVGPDGFTKSGQLSGTHNLANATSALDAKGACL